MNPQYSRLVKAREHQADATHHKEKRIGVGIVCWSSRDSDKSGVASGAPFAVDRASDSVWFHHFYPKFDADPTFTEELWASRADGERMREIGYVLSDLESGSQGEDHFDDLNWLPDGKEISFLYHGTLYVAPADL